MDETEAQEQQDREILDELYRVSEPLIGSTDLDDILERSSQSQLVLIGEATHGTHEFYTWRSELTKRLLIENHFSFIAVEGDWPECEQINRYVKGWMDLNVTARDVLDSFRRWPTWMWANEEMVEFVEWLKDFNEDFEDDQKVGFYGIDLYSLWESLKAVREFVKESYPADVTQVDDVARCFEPYWKDLQQYSVATHFINESCERDVALFLSEMLEKRFESTTDEVALSVIENSKVVRNAERYYRALIGGDVESWNLRDRHMVATLMDLIRFYGDDSQGIVWAHNSHVGDARGTDLAKEGIETLGQLACEKLGSDAITLIGFGTYEGKVVAASTWDGPARIQVVPPALEGSWDELLHRVNADNKYLITDIFTDTPEFRTRRGQRAIGVVYDPDYDIEYFTETDLMRRYDVFIFINSTTPVQPLHYKPDEDNDLPQTYPSGE